MDKNSGGDMTNILILGIDGMLGHQIFKKFTENSNFNVFGTTRGIFSPSEKIFNFSVSDDILVLSNIVHTHNIQIIINGIGVLNKSTDIYNSIKVNSLFPHELATRYPRINIIHFSTDCVFSGKGVGNYKETDIPDEINLYGQTKMMGELTYPNTITIRTSIIGPQLKGRKDSLYEWFLSQNNKEIEGFCNYYYSGMTTFELARLIEKLIEKYPTKLHGLFHLSGPFISKYDLLVKIRDRFDLNIKINRNTEYYSNKTLNMSLFKTTFPDIIVSNWDYMIKELYEKDYKLRGINNEF